MVMTSQKENSSWIVQISDEMIEMDQLWRILDVVGVFCKLRVVFSLMSKFCEGQYLTIYALEDGKFLKLENKSQG